MRLRIGVLRQRVKANLPIEFVPQRLTSYGGLELIRRYFRRLDLRRRADQVLAAAGVRSDYGSGRVLLLVLALLVVGARRLEHLQYIGGDPLVGRLCGLRRLPTARTVANWLKQFTQRGVQALRTLNRDLLGAHLRRLGLARLTIDVDGTVISTGSQVAWAFRGFNPHQRKKPSYYPLLAHLAQTGQILDLRNRPGNVHDSRGAARFLSALITDLRQRLGRAVALEFRMDAAFFQQEVLRLLQRRGCEYAIKVGFWKWVGLKARVAAQREWTRLTDVLSAFEATVPCTPWGLTLRVVIYRRRVQHETRKNFQLNLFSPDDGHFEYSAVTTNKALGPGALWDFMAGRGAQEKTLPSSRASLPSMSCRPTTTAPTAPGNSSASWRTICCVASSSTRSPPPSRGVASGPTPTSCAACGRCAFSSWCAPVASAASATGRCCACPRTLPPRPSTNVWSMPSPRELFSDQG